MKKILLFSVLSLFIVMVGCNSNGKNDIYGEYTFEEVSYLSPISSMLKDTLKENMKDGKYIIQKDLYKVQSSELNIEIVSPKYVKEEIDMDSLIIFETDFFRMNNIKSRYYIYDKDGNKTNSVLFVSPNDLWISTRTNLTPDGQLIVFNMIKLSH